MSEEQRKETQGGESEPTAAASSSESATTSSTGSSGSFRPSAGSAGPRKFGAPRPGGSARFGGGRGGRGGRGGGRGGRGFAPRRRKVCRFCVDQVDYIDFKQVQILRSFMSERGKILGGRVTGNCAKHQRQLGRGIRRARVLALLPYVVK